MKRRFDTKKPHEPYELYLDEGVSGPKLVSLLGQARLIAHLFQSLLPRNKKVSDSRVIQVAAAARYVLVTTDKRMEALWIEDMIRHQAQVILLSDESSGPIHWAADLIAGQAAWQRVLLDHPGQPVTIKLARSGTVTSVAGELELRARRDRLLTARIVQYKKSGKVVKRGARDK